MPRSTVHTFLVVILCTALYSWVAMFAWLITSSVSAVAELCGMAASIAKHSGKMIKSFDFVNTSLHLSGAVCLVWSFVMCLWDHYQALEQHLVLQDQFLNSKHYKSRCWHVIPLFDRAEVSRLFTSIQPCFFLLGS